MAQTTTRAPATGTELAEISRLVVQAFARFTGRGPVKARTSMDIDSVHVVLYDLLSTTEQSLVESGQVEMVLALRRAVQEGVGPAMIEGVEAVTGRKVTAFLSVNHVAPDVCVETFILEPLVR